MSKLFSASICLTDLGDAFKKGHSAFNKSEKNGKVYVNINLWENDAPDNYGNTHSFQANPKKDSGDEKFYCGNAKPVVSNKVNQNVTQLPDSSADDDDLPF